MPGKREGKQFLAEAAVVGFLGTATMSVGCRSGDRALGPTDPPQHIRWLKENAKPIATVDPAAKDDDLAAFDTVVGEASIVGLGEATHGSSEFFRMKHRLLRYLVEHRGFTAFGLEADLAQCRALDAYVLTGMGDPRGLVEDLGMWIWATEEMVDLVTWMKTYNADPSHLRKVRFFGFDIQDGAAAMSYLLTYLASVDALGEAYVRTLFAPYAPFTGLVNPARQVYRVASQDLQVLCSANLHDARTYLVTHRDRLVAASGNSAFEWALRMADLLIQQEGYFRLGEHPQSLVGVNIRDRAMAHNVNWAVRHLDPGIKAVIWAHNGHINKQGAFSPLWVNTGEWLAQDHRAGYVSVGFSFGAGGFNTVPMDLYGLPGTPRAVHAPPPEDGAYEAAFLEAGMPLALLDLRRIDFTDPGALWFNQSRSFREIGDRYNYAAGASSSMTMLLDRFDALIFVRNVTPSRLLGQGRRSGDGAGPPPPPR